MAPVRHRRNRPEGHCVPKAFTPVPPMPMQLVMVFVCKTNFRFAVPMEGGREALVVFKPVRMLVYCPSCSGRHVYAVKEGKLGEWDGERLHNVA